MAWQKARIKIPEGYSPEVRERIGEDIKRMIKDRAAQGQGVKPTGRGYRLVDFPDYSPAYAKRKGSTRVDLVLDDEMLEDIEVLSTTKDSILIGYENGTKSNAKAEGNQTGSYGRSPNPKKARPFLGVTNEELEAILAGYE